MTVVIRSYREGKVLKKLHIEGDHSITYGVEKDRFVVRDYRTGEKIKSCQAPACSISYDVER